MKQRLHAIVLTAALVIMLPVKTRAAQLLIPVGEVIGLQLRDETVTVAAFDDKLGDRARQAGVKIGDALVAVDGCAIENAEDVLTALQNCGEQISLTVCRNGTNHTLHMLPRETEEGKKLGLYLRQGIAGIGTVTWYDPDSGAFGTLGHGVSTGKGKLLALKEGSAYSAQVISVIPGECGEPGQLKGSAQEVCGALLRNTHQGVFGISPRGWQGQALPVAEFEEIQTGPATIRSTVADREVREYSVEILKIYPQDRLDSRNFLLKVTDPALLAATGGIVQGMSGSPIIQDGKLVGAVTHVLVNDPTRGYGIFIGNMLEAAE